MNDNTKFDLTEIQKDLWRERIIVPKLVLDYLVADHQQKIMAFAQPLMEVSTDSLMENLSGMLATGDCDWYVEPAKKTCASIDKLSKGFAMVAGQISDFFEDIYIGQDFKDILLNPEQAPAVYPNTISAANGYFLKTISKHLPEDFWFANQELKDVKTSISCVGDFAANEQTMSQTTTLMCLFEAQRMSRIMPLVEKELKNSNHANLAIIANCFALKGKAMSDDIIAKTEAAISSNQPLNVINNSATGLKNSI